MYLKICCVMICCGVLVLLHMKKVEYSDDCDEENCGSYDGSETNEMNPRILSRRKRFLVFPDGSSLQLVFCVQTSALIPIGDIFLYGSTAALAWKLPEDPNFLLMLKEHEKTATRRNDGKNIYFIDHEGKLLAKAPYSRPEIVNPAFAKRSVDEKMTYKEKLKIKIDRTKMHQRQSKRDFLKKENMDRDSIEFHRQSRVSLYEKLVPFITALGGDGTQCVLYKLCETARISRQGTFLQELLRVVFTLPKGKEFEEEEHKNYDKAHVPSDDCASMYPGCDVDIPVQSQG